MEECVETSMETGVEACEEQVEAKAAFKQTMCKKIPPALAWTIIGVASAAVLITLLVLIGQV